MMPQEPVSKWHSYHRCTYIGNNFILYVQKETQVCFAHYMTHSIQHRVYHIGKKMRCSHCIINSKEKYNEYCSNDVVTSHVFEFIFSLSDR